MAPAPSATRCTSSTAAAANRGAVPHAGVHVRLHLRCRAALGDRAPARPATRDERRALAHRVAPVAARPSVARGRMAMRIIGSCIAAILMLPAIVTANEGGGGGAIKVSSSAFENGGKIPSEY